MRKFPLVRELIAKLGRVDAFAPYTFACTAYPPSVLDGDWYAPAITRSFRYWVDGASSTVRIHGSTGTKWHRAVVRSLKRAGYRRTMWHDNETTCQRWLHGTRQRDAELAFLASLGPDASPGRWPARLATTAAFAETLDRRRWAEAVDLAWSSNVDWNECVIGFHRRGHLGRVAGREEGLQLLVAVLGVEGVDDRVETYVSAHDPANRPLSVSVVAAVRSECASARFSLGTISGPLFYGLKQVRTVSAAIRDSTRIFGRLSR